MKRKIALFLTGAMVMSALPAGVYADDYTQVNLLVEGQAVETDQPAVIVDSRTMVPVRVIAETLGCEVDWDVETKTVTFTQGSIVATMVVGEKTLNVTNNGVTTAMEIDTPAVIINNRTMVPVRFLTELFGFNVDWDAVTKTVNVTAGETAADDITSGSAVSTEITTEETTETSNTAEATETEEDIALLETFVESMDKGIEILQIKEDEFTDEEDEEFVEQCDVVATILQGLSFTTPMTDEEIAASEEAALIAYDSFATLAEKYGVSDEFEEAAKDYTDAVSGSESEEEVKADETSSKEELKAYAEAVDKGVEVLDNVSGGFNDDEQVEFDAQCDALATVLKEVSSDMTDEEIEAANETVDKAKESFETLAKTYSVDSDFAEALGEYAE